jgi:regulator of Ty1 transposition protein 103
LLIESLK